jgi:hypothetical protein
LYQPVNDIKGAIVNVARLKGPIMVTDGAPHCEYYEDKTLPRTGAEVAVSVCSGPNSKSATGWGIWINVITNHGRSLNARSEVDEFIRLIKQAIIAIVKNQQVTVETVSFYLL